MSRIPASAELEHGFEIVVMGVIGELPRHPARILVAPVDGREGAEAGADRKAILDDLHRRRGEDPPAGRLRGHVGLESFLAERALEPGQAKRRTSRPAPPTSPRDPARDGAPVDEEARHRRRDDEAVAGAGSADRDPGEDEDRDGDADDGAAAALRAGAAGRHPAGEHGDERQRAQQQGRLVVGVREEADRRGAVGDGVEAQPANPGRPSAGRRRARSTLRRPPAPPSGAAAGPRWAAGARAGTSPPAAAGAAAN